MPNREVSSFQALLSTQMRHFGRTSVLFMEVPHFRGVSSTSGTTPTITRHWATIASTSWPSNLALAHPAEPYFICPVR